MISTQCLNNSDIHQNSWEGNSFQEDDEDSKYNCVDSIITQKYPSLPLFLPPNTPCTEQSLPLNFGFINGICLSQYNVSRPGVVIKLQNNKVYWKALSAFSVIRVSTVKWGVTVGDNVSKDRLRPDQKWSLDFFNVILWTIGDH